MDARQINKLMDDLGAPLVLFARQWCQQPEDAVQNALLDLLGVKSDPEDPAAWLFTAVRRKAMNIARTERRIAARQDVARQTREPWFEAAIDQRLIAAEIESSLEALADVERQIVVARIWGDLNFSQIAEITNLPSSTVHRRYKQALAKLSSMLNEAPKQSKH